MVRVDESSPQTLDTPPFNTERIMFSQGIFSSEPFLFAIMAITEGTLGETN
jgi:hypothetical protein